MWEHLEKLVTTISSLPFADKDRIYLMGASMGGYATWQLAMSMPEVFAAVVPVCGGGTYWHAHRLVNVPVWAFHGGKDTVVFKEESINMVDAVNKCGGNAKLTIYPENEHDAWSDTYSNPEVFDWLLSNENGSYVYNEEWNKIDHFFLSENVSFLSFSTISDYTDENGYPIKYSVRTGKGYSDHLPIMCQLSF